MPQDKEQYTEPSMWESGSYIGHDLDPKPAPGTEVAGRLGVKYGDIKTASVGGRGYEAMAAISNVMGKYKPEVGRADKHASNVPSGGK